MPTCVPAVAARICNPPWNPVTSRPTLFSAPNLLNPKPLTTCPRPSPFGHIPTHAIFKPGVQQRFVFSGVFPERVASLYRAGPSWLRSCLENTFEVRANLSSPQGVRSVGRRLFENLILQASGNASRVSRATHFHPQGWPSGPKRLTIEYARLPDTSVVCLSGHPLLNRSDGLFPNVASFFQTDP